MKRALTIFSLLFNVSLSQAEVPAVTTALDEAKGTVSVNIGGSLFTTLHVKGFAKPVIHPIIGPTGLNMVREWPVKDAAPNEEKDHPHHKGLWFTHGAVNGVDFWKEAKDAGTITVTGNPETGKNDSGSAFVKTTEDWKAPDGRKICTSTTTIIFNSARTIDYTITLTASEGDVTMGETKEGTMGIRSHPVLNLKGKSAAGKALNSEGQKDGDIWGKRARWVDYFAPIDGKTVGFACFDHPSNLRHPTTWHARDYGLVAANPFGLHDFDKKNPKGSGNHTIKKGESLILRYLWVFHNGDAAEAKIEEQWKTWSSAAK